MNQDTLLILAVLIGGMVAIAWWLQRQLKTQQTSADWEKVVNQIFGMTSQKIAEQSRQVLAGEQSLIKTELNHKHEAMSEMMKELRNELQQRQRELRGLEVDRTEKFTQLATELEHHRKLMDELQVTTRQLTSALANNQHRGEWGERIIEDLLQANGFVEGIHYLRQSKQSISALRPDITLLLPNKRTVPVDVKFPFAEMQKWLNADTKLARDQHLKQFASDLRSKVVKVAGYIDSAQNTLDYAILFVPNEAVFSFINQKLPDVVDEAIGKRVLIVSPFTFLIVARTVMESYRNFMIGDKLRDAVAAVDDFAKEWDVFKQKFGKYGRSLDTLKQDYEELTGTRVRQLEKKMTKINTYRDGAALGEEKKVPVIEAETV